MGKIDLVTDTLRRELQEGRYELHSSFPSEYELADRFRINKKTANKAVALLVAEGYLQRGKSGAGTHVKMLELFPRNLIAFIGEITHPYYAKIVNGIQLAALENNSLVCLIAPKANRLGMILEKVRNSNVSGIITSHYGTLNIPGIPVIYAEEKTIINVGETHDYVASNSYQGAYAMMREILARGHRNIVMVSFYTDSSRRLEGFHAALREQGISDVAERTFLFHENSDYDTEMIYSKMVHAYPDFTAVATTSDDNLFRMARCLEKKGIQWRGRIAMTGFGNVAGISNMLPVATVDQHPFHIGQAAFYHLMEKIRNPELKIEDIIDPELSGLENIPYRESRR